jgi:hypothetical protein
MRTRSQGFIGGAERARRQAQSKGWEAPSAKRRRLEKEEEKREKQSRRAKKRNKTYSGQESHCVPLLKKKLRSSERFFASLLEAPNFPRWNSRFSIDPNTDSAGFQGPPLEYICGKLGIGPISMSEGFFPHTENPKKFFASRAILVMEEARHQLNEALQKHYGDEKRQCNTVDRRLSRSRNSWNNVRLDSGHLDKKRTGFLYLGFAKASGRFSPEELAQQRTGSCFELEAISDGTTTATTTTTRVMALGAVAPGKSGPFSNIKLVIYERAAIDRLVELLQNGQEQEEQDSEDSRLDGDHSSHVRFRIRFCVSLLSQCRQFEACDFGKTGHRGSDALLKKIMGQKEATHTRFSYSDDDNNNGGDATPAENDVSSKEGEEKTVEFFLTNGDDEDLIRLSVDDDVVVDDDDDDDDDRNNKYHNGKLKEASAHLTISSFTGLKALNPTQQKAVKKFCSSDKTKATLELIQGPPGTGKTTFVVSVLARLLCQGPEKGKRTRRILVTAPTNKAVGVIAKRFLESCPGLLTEHGIPVCMIGVQNKLLESNEDGTEDERLRSILCYTWLDSLADEYGRLLDGLSSETIGGNHPSHDGTSEAATKTTWMAGDRAVSPWLSNIFPPSSSDTLMVDEESDTDTEEEEEIRNHRVPTAIREDGWSTSAKAKANILHVRLMRNLPRWSEASGAANLSRKLLNFLNEGDVSGAFAYTKTLVKLLKDECAESSSDSENDKVKDRRRVRAADAVPELLASAVIVFCTLSTAGSALMKKNRKFDDWIVDEAAAATEPELLIPLHLNPFRLLVVGDPKQLPASVSSPFSEQWGLGRSLHERLTVDLGRSQTMLDVQYRMKPEIAEFPSQQFYNGRLTNGENVKDTNYGSLLVLNKPLVEFANGTFRYVAGEANVFDGNSSSGDLLETTPPFCYFQVNGKEQQSHTGSSYNTEEAVALVTLLKIIRSRHQQGKGEHSSWCSPDKIRVITFYSAQVVIIRQMLLREGLQGVLVATVDSSQGCEADVVVLSFVRTKNAGFLKDDRRLNVALTRARHKLFCLGNIAESTWASGYSTGASSSTLTNLVHEVRRRKCLSLALAETKQTSGGGPKKKRKKKAKR